MGDMDDHTTQAMLNKSPKPHQEGSKAPQYIFTIAATMCAFCAGTALAWTSPALPAIMPKDNETSINGTLVITPEEGSWVGSLLPVGALLGALPAGYFSNRFGRKLTCASLSLPFVASWLLITYASSAMQLYLARIIVGIATGASSAVAPMYVGEIAEASVRGSLGSFFQLMMTVGILYTYVLGAVVSYTTLAIVCGVVPIAFLLMFFNAPESPVYLISKGRRSEAEASLKRLRGRGYDVSYELNELQKEIEKSSGNEVSFSDIFKRKAAFRALIISLGLMVFQQISGINAVIFYANSIFLDAGSTLDPAISTIIVGVIQVVVTYASSLLVDKAGRKILLLISAAVMGICQGLLGLYFYLKENGNDVSNITMIPLASVGLFIIIFSLGFGPIPWMMTGELFSSDIKGPCTGMAVGLNWFLAFLVTKLFGPLKTLLGSGITFGMFGVICGVGVVFVLLLVPETKGKSLDEIQRMLGEEDNRRKSLA
ncbi:facilitated trehalose transporter Tret1-like [Macrosteles quadrilineatus]|uniref:facilitated trehalose transporter Tret1-like n=1 Tax=Macrosteles quadrilineatus TaxID=74068 RepID=UPI0023E31DFA|nr:facilitated trehalose transporter Tret1-like [Macrosteles quadrilineatus]XP_054258656.1 facilitated trehalose transporter Tret1-like [Macrosteles quadrilineatus]